MISWIKRLLFGKKLLVITTPFHSVKILKQMELSLVKLTNQYRLLILPEGVDVHIAEQKIKEMADAAEMLWVVLANVSEGDWTKQTKEWQDAAAKWRDNYHKKLKELRLI